MKIMSGQGPMEMVVVGLAPDEMLLESLKKAIATRGIRNGAVISGAGTLKSCRMHYVDHVGFPPQDVFCSIEGPLELVALNGVIADGEPHLHVVVSMKEQPARAGHLEDGSQVLYLAEVAILVCESLAMARQLDEARKIKLIGPA
ncbi:MAG: PPC domain-containing DNA-binding protein [Candidatus Coatesbacteria bacterium]